MKFIVGLVIFLFANNSFAQQVDLTVNLLPVNSVEISGETELNISNPSQWNGISIVSSSIISGSAFASSKNNKLAITTNGFGNPLLNTGIDIIVNGYRNSIFNATIGAMGNIPIKQGLNDLDVLFETNGNSFQGVNPSSYFISFDFSIISY